MFLMCFKCFFFFKKNFCLYLASFNLQSLREIFFEAPKIVRFTFVGRKNPRRGKINSWAEASVKEFLEILSRGNRILPISFAERVRKRNPFTGHVFGTENLPSKKKRTKN